ncbi:hypothetical protein BT63DRAFT_428172 [Microthyrium microscopicum]|uniref:Cerato-platanin n=1 Tax=Microthyrium microscopicum TaxID=703497 RepID=A0A6A6U284_9PEZI|nr:hypothetical protein BT63DRAFT_428172 [Microthyrium microscopicum]
MRGSYLISWLAASICAVADTTTVWTTPHDSYSSSVGVLGCYVNTNRIAYWPMSVDCTNICVSLSYGGRSVYLLRVDQSGGAYDVSYDAWNYLITGSSATSKPTAGGATEMQYEAVDASKCASLITTDGHKLPLSASNSMDFLASCISQTSSWVAKNYVLYNILDSLCSYGYDETCTLDLSKSNQATCKHQLGMPVALTSLPVYNIQYPSGKKVLASSNPSANATPSSGFRLSMWKMERFTMLVILVVAYIYK